MAAFVSRNPGAPIIKIRRTHKIGFIGCDGQSLSIRE
jgi:hypothetical protein